MEPAAPSIEIAGMTGAQAALTATIDGLSDDAARGPSLLPGWTVGHVLTHLARNADSVVRRLVGAGEGRMVDQYVGGAEGRRRDIDKGASRSAHELVADVLRSNSEVEAVAAAFPADAWERLTRSVGGRELPARAVIWSRWREVSIHHVDLGLGYEMRDWPDDLVELWLPDAKEKFLGSADQRDLLGWLLGRGGAPQLAPWD